MEGFFLVNCALMFFKVTFQIPNSFRKSLSEYFAIYCRISYTHKRKVSTSIFFNVVGKRGEKSAKNSSPAIKLLQPA